MATDHECGGERVSGGEFHFPVPASTVPIDGAPKSAYGAIHITAEHGQQPRPVLYVQVEPVVVQLLGENGKLFQPPFGLAPIALNQRNPTRDPQALGARHGWFGYRRKHRLDAT